MHECSFAGRCRARASPAAFEQHGSHATLGLPHGVRVHQAEGVPLSAYLGVLGGTGLMAFVGLTRIAHPQPGEDLFVSAAAGGWAARPGRSPG